MKDPNNYQPSNDYTDLTHKMVAAKRAGDDYNFNKLKEQRAKIKTEQTPTQPDEFKKRLVRQRPTVK